MIKILFIDRDGTLVLEPDDEQIDSLEKLEFYPEVFTYLGKISKELDYELVMVTNQDGLGTKSFPEEFFWPAHNKLLNSFQNEGVTFSEIFIDRSFPNDNASTRKPRTGMLTNYLDNSEYNLSESYVIGDRISDMELAKNLNSKGILINIDNIKPKEETKNDFDVFFRFFSGPHFSGFSETVFLSSFFLLQGRDRFFFSFFAPKKNRKNVQKMKKMKKNQKRTEKTFFIYTKQVQYHCEIA